MSSSRDQKTAQPCTTLSCPELAVFYLWAPSHPSPFSVFSLPSVLPLMFLAATFLPFQSCLSLATPQPQLLSGTHCIALHMKMSCHTFQPLKQRLFLGEVVLTVLCCSSHAEHKAGDASAEGGGGVQQLNTHAGLLAVHSEGTEGL